jgi:ferric-dicitrate binding protein FerR (iron transport regulator)
MTEEDLNLLHRYLDDAITSAELTSLEELLRTNAEARSTLRSLATIDAKWQQLAADNEVANAGKDRVVPIGSSDPRRSWLSLGRMAAILLLGLFVWLSRPGHPDGPALGIARVIRVEGEVRVDGERILAGGDELFPAENLTISKGLIELAFRESGVHMVATAPLTMRLDNGKRVYLHEGEVKLVVPPQGVGFVVETLERRITDLGTSFVVKAQEDGAKVLVLDGQISVGKRDGSPEELMVMGESADFDRDGEMHRRAQRPSGVPELTLGSMEPSAASLSGRLIAFTNQVNHTGQDVIGHRVLPLVRSGFRDESCLAGLQVTGPLRFTGIAGTYDNFPKTNGLEPYETRHGWLAWYHGQMAPPRPGRYRFWGYADNHLLVSVNGKPVFEGSRFSSSLRENLDVARDNHPSLPCLNAAAGFASGEWFELGKESVRLDLLFGEQRENMTSGLLLLERADETYEETLWGQPKWPLFLTEPPTEPEVIELENLRRHMEEKLMGSFSIDAATIWKTAPATK